MAIDLFSIGKFTIHGYGLMIALGFLLALLYGMWWCRKSKLNEDYFFNLALFVLFFGWAGGKLLFCIVEFKSFINNPLGVLGSEGFVVYGGIISGIVTMIVYCRVKKLDTLKYIDIIAAAVTINQGFGRLGCFLAGCCYGAETDGPIYVIFPEGCMAPAGVKLLPTQLFSAGGDFLLCLILFFVLKKGLKKGVGMAVYLIGYSIGRFIIEIFRNDLRGSVGALSTSQFISIFMLILGIIIYVVVTRFDKEETVKTEDLKETSNS